jgi:hypothetical protein
VRCCSFHGGRGEADRLAHAIGDRVEAAYRRGELMQKRAAMMAPWGRFLLEPKTADVVAIGRRRRA